MLLHPSLLHSLLIPLTFAAAAPNPALPTRPTGTASVSPAVNSHVLILPPSRTSADTDTHNVSSPYKASTDLPYPPRPPYTIPIRFTSTSITFTSYGHSIPLGRALDVLSQAHNWLGDNVAVHSMHELIFSAGVRERTFRWWTLQGDIRFSIRPGGKMQWSHVASLMMQVYDLMRRYRATEFRAEVVDTREGVLGWAELRVVERVGGGWRVGGGGGDGVRRMDVI